MTSGPPSLPAPTIPTNIVVVPKINGSPQDVAALSTAYSALMASPTARSDARAAALRPFPFQINAVKNDAYFNPADGSVNVDPNFHPMTQTAAGPQPAPTSVIIGHEIGHRLGGLDDGPGNMNNVNKFENPIRRDLGIPDRIVY
jgi:hypothetical protein